MILQWLFLMVWCHLIDDYCLQSFCLANLKQKKFWRENVSETEYKKDYLMGLFAHSMMWAVSIMIPTMISGNFIWWLVPINCAIHFVVDDIKANRHKINLIADQLIHFVQIALTFCLCYIWLV